MSGTCQEHILRTISTKPRTCSASSIYLKAGRTQHAGQSEAHTTSLCTFPKNWPWLLTPLSTPHDDLKTSARPHTRTPKRG